MQSLRLRKIPCYPSSLRRSLHMSTRLLRPSSGAPTKPHSADSYFKDVDETPPQDPTIHRVDAASEAAQSSYEPPSGQWNQAGVGTSEYEHVSKDAPYDVSPNNGQAKEKNLRYGGTERLDAETSRPGEGPEGQAREGRKPE
ncbi:hypothetical protein DEU56DRAFT_736903 [Suillus clintonianus]|uniref:uncharacterized protein n=1 Tax=Suillus clintonianus TaxID=1904413 RepID=UPI001B882587|nr:uncharacterized protein DEU56DRAFT_736903 [Suillus clintonianus]KAG2137059.1 hypothetical protein DEU56DRAFT_736903 [Suillus clintonianus]